MNIKNQVLEAHFGYGRLAVAERLPNFTRVYDLAERVIPAEHHGRKVEREEAQRESRAASHFRAAFSTVTLPASAAIGLAIEELMEGAYFAPVYGNTLMGLGTQTPFDPAAD